MAGGAAILLGLFQAAPPAPEIDLATVAASDAAITNVTIMDSTSHTLALADVANIFRVTLSDR